MEEKINEKKFYIKEQIKGLFLWRDVTFVKFIKKLNKIKGKNDSVSNFSHKLKNQTIKFKEVLEVCDILGYEIVFKPKANWQNWDDK